MHSGWLRQASGILLAYMLTCCYEYSSTTQAHCTNCKVPGFDARDVASCFLSVIGRRMLCARSVANCLYAGTSLAMSFAISLTWRQLLSAKAFPTCQPGSVAIGGSSSCSAIPEVNNRNGVC